MWNPSWQPSSMAALQGASSFGLQQDELAPQDELDLPVYIQEAAQMHQVSISLTGTATVDWDAAALVTVLDNLLGNVSSLSRDSMQNARCAVVIETVTNNGSKAVQIRFETPHLPLEIPLEKLFEPWASSRNTNKGLGLYQARKQVLAAGGQLTAQRLETGISVTLSIPCKKS